MNDAITVSGLRETQKALYAYSQQLGDKVVLSALRQGANLVLKAARSEAPVRTGKLRKGIRIARSRIHRGRTSADLIGIYIGIRKGKSSAFYGRFQEDGWVAGKIRHHRIPGKHFIENAYNQKKSAAVDLIVRSAQAGAELLAKKVGF